MPIGYRQGQRTKIREDGRGNTLVTKRIIDAVASDDMVKLEIAADNTEQIKAALNDAIVAALVEMGMACERFAKLECPVDTGRLRNSITYALATGEKAVYVGTNVEYAFSVHEGTGTNRNIGPRPFLKNAATNHAAYYMEIQKKHLQGG